MTGGIVAVFSGGGTGGHLYPALALAGALRERRPDVRPFFIGARRGIEARVLPGTGIEHLLVPVEGIRRGAFLGNARVLRSLLSALAQVAAAVHRLRPHLVVVTGGYAGGPAGIVAVLTRTQLVLQEQNALPGVTTRLLSRFAREVHVAFPESVGALPKRSRARVRVSGNPVRPPLEVDRGAAARELGLDPAAPIVLVVGGSQGSEALNEAVLAAVREVAAGRLPRPRSLQLLWATGPAHIGKISAALAEAGSPSWVHAVGYLDRVPLALAAADLAVSRAGAMATAEFLAAGVPSVLVPLPTAAADHQSRNAEALAAAGAAVTLRQDGLTGASLWGAVTGILGDAERREAMARAARARGRPRAAEEIAASLDRLLPAPRAEGRGAAPEGRHMMGPRRDDA